MVNRDNTPQVLGALRHNFPIETQFAVFAVTPDGRISIHASDVLKQFCDKWYHDGVRSDALAAVSAIAGRKRSHVAISVNTAQPTATPLAEDQANAIGGQIVSPLPGDAMESSNTSVEHPSPSSTSTGRPRKKQRRVSNGSQSHTIDTPATTSQKRIRQRKVGQAKPTKATTFIKQESNDGDGNDGEKEWENMETPITGSRDEDPPGDEEAGEEAPLVPLCIGKEADVINYLWSKFVQIQQLDCKVIAKAWVRVIEPKKQAHSPYNGGDATRPWWWPDEAPHKEPDHLLKNARIRVLVSCISDQLVPISQLRAATDETSLRPSQKEILHEMYDVMELYQRMRAEQLDRNHIRLVRPFIKGNKRRKKRATKTPPQTSNPQGKKSNIKKETESQLNGSLDSELPMTDFLKAEEEEGDDCMLITNSNFSPVDVEFAGKDQTQVGDSQLANIRRSSTGVIKAAPPGENPLLDYQSRSNSVPSLQNVSNPFGNIYVQSSPQFPDQKSESEMSDSSQQPFEWTPSPATLASPVYTHITSPNITGTILAPTQVVTASTQPSAFTYPSIFDPMIQPSATDTPMLGTSEGEIYVDPPYNSDAYTGYALQEVASYQNYNRTFYPNPNMQDTAMIDGNNGFTQQRFH